MLPVEMHTRLANHRHEVELCIRLAQAIMRSRAKHEPILDGFFGITRYPSLRVEIVRLRIDFGIMQCRPYGRDDHGALWCGVIGRNGKALLGDIGNHDDWRSIAKCLLYHSSGIWHILKDVHTEPLVPITIAHGEILFTDTVEDFGSISHELEEPGRCAAGRVLSGEEEGEDGH